MLNYKYERIIFFKKLNLELEHLKMGDINDFFSSRNTINSISNEDRNKTADYLEPIKAFAKTTYKSIYLIDYHEKGFEYVSENPLFLCGHTSEEVKEMGYLFYFKYVVEKDLDLLLRINTIGFDFYEKIPLEERKLYTISYDYHLNNQEGKTILINQTLTPLFLTNDGKIWKALCVISLSNEQNSGNIKIYKDGENKIYSYNLKGDFWKTKEKIKLTDREKEILIHSISGSTINEIAEKIFISPETVKFHRKKILNKLEVSNISEAIFFAINNKLF
jgi:DNA-binding CsgD family transcriptional regulator